jgi:hypothetical protein
VTDALGVGTLACVGHAWSNIVTLKEIKRCIAITPGKASQTVTA